MKVRRGLAPLAAGTALVLVVLLPSMPGLVAQTSSPVTGCQLATSSSSVAAGGQLGLSGGSGCFRPNQTIQLGIVSGNVASFSGFSTGATPASATPQGAAALPRSGTISVLGLLSLVRPQTVTASSLGSTPSDSNGNISTVVTIPSNLTPGTYTVGGVDPRGDTASAVITVTSAAVPVTAAPTATPSSGALAATGHEIVRWTLRGLALLLGGVLIMMGVRRWREVRYWT